MELLRKMMLQEDHDLGIHAGEAYSLWTQLVARYDTLELTQMILNFAKDTDFKALTQRGLEKLIMPQINKLEETMNRYQVPLPTRPPSSMNIPTNIEVARDEGMFRIILSGSQTALLVHVKAINMSINDSLRGLFMNFLDEELRMYDDLVKYGKTKGWVHQAPKYNH